MNETSLQSQNGGPNESSLDLHNFTHFDAVCIGGIGLQCSGTPHATDEGCGTIQLLPTSLFAWPALSLSSPTGLCQRGGMAQ